MVVVKELVATSCSHLNVDISDIITRSSFQLQISLWNHFKRDPLKSPYSNIIHDRP